MTAISITTPDQPETQTQIKYRETQYQLCIHEDVLDALEELPHLRKRLSLVLTHLAARGHTTITKSCNPPNTGWRRSPMGGQHGTHHYLWWCASDARPMQGQDDIPPNYIWIRALRHHHDHRPLSAGDPHRHYLPVTAHDATQRDGGLVDDPKTTIQQDFVQSSGPIRIIRGHPGTGKTTALWQAIEARQNQNVLYVTWSKHLAEQAQEHFRSFAPRSCSVTCLSFSDLLTAINGEPVPVMGHAQRVDLTKQALHATSITARAAGPWSSAEAIYAELHGHMIGAAIPDRPGTDTDPTKRIAHLTPEQYLHLRGRDSQLGEAAASAMAKITQQIIRHPRARDLIISALPELAAARAAIINLRQHRPPAHLENIHRIAIDEAQDLTITELSVITELTSAIQRRSDTSPWLLMAGDESQTVQPSGFDWARVAQHLTETLGAPQEYTLNTNARAPDRIAAAIAAVTGLYATIGRDVRPSNRHAPPSGDLHPGEVAITIASNRQDLIDTIRAIADRDDVRIIHPSHEPPHWLPLDLRPQVLTPQDAKGIEHPAVCVLLAGETVRQVRATAQTKRNPVDATTARQSIDLLRVSISRATETVLFLENADSAPHVLDLLPDAPAYSASETHHVLDQSDDTSVRLKRKMREAAEQPDAERAWATTEHAIYLAGEDDAHHPLRQELDRLIITTAFRLIEQQKASAETRRHAHQTANKAAERIHGPGSAQNTLDSLAAWRSGSTGPSPLLDATTSAHHDVRAYVTPILERHADEIESHIQSLADQPNQARRVAENAQQWLQLLQRPSPASTAADLRRRAAETAIKHRRHQDAAAILDTLPADERTIGHARLLRKQGLWAEALRAIQDHSDPQTVADFTAQIAEDAFQAARALEERQDMAAAITACDTVLEIDPLHVRSLEMKARCSLARYDGRACIPPLERILEITPDDTDTMAYLALAYGASGRNEEAQEMLERAMAIAPENALLWEMHGISQASQRQPHAAIAALQRSLELSQEPSARITGIIANCYAEAYETFLEEGDSDGAAAARADTATAISQALDLQPLCTPALAAIIQIVSIDNFRPMDALEQRDPLLRCVRRHHLDQSNRTLLIAFEIAEQFLEDWNPGIEVQPRRVLAALQSVNPLRMSQFTLRT